VNGERTVVVLAAGEGRRMRSAVPKVLHPVLGRTLLGHVLAAAAALDARHTAVVVGHRADLVQEHLARVYPDVLPVHQAEQLGTGHAARIAMEALEGVGATGGTIVIINGDVPLLRPQTLSELVRAHETTGATATILTAVVADPTGLGRIVRHPDGGPLEAIVEEPDATPAQRAITEINAGVYVFDGPALGEALSKLTTHNEQGEEYLTDVIGLFVGSGRPVAVHCTPDPVEVLGCNDRVELAALNAQLRDRINTAWMRAGVTIIDPATAWIDSTVTLGTDAVIEPNTHLRGATEVAENAVIGPDTTLVDVRVGPAARVVRTHAESVSIGARAKVGPYAYLRPGTVLHEDSKVGTFVEVKNSEVGAGTKIPHLSYVGDATIGEHSNIGAANVVANYDGVRKHRTVIGSHVRTGSDTVFVAPVSVGDGTYTAAGSVIVKDVPPGALGVSRSPQRNVEGWVERRRADTPAARAAAAAQAAQAAAAGEAGADDSAGAPGDSGTGESNTATE
jgi:bifunctional UDP-N-acetylglucosamine pyrophosphorylase/glucosamine-1-phosphate N-acetyltransferase